MATKGLWAKSSSGPDWVDIEATMRAVGKLHAGVVSLTILPCGTGATGGFRIVTTYAESIDAVQGPDDITCLETEWPCREGCTFAGHCYAQLIALDFQLEMMRTDVRPPK
jgi:hypothetical protein